MKTITSGHLNNNGGIRGHSAGEIFPFRVMAQGKLDALVWHVIKPNGEKLGRGQTNITSAYKVAHLAFNIWSK